jgi:hypothetical protein
LWRISFHICLFFVFCSEKVWLFFSLVKNVVKRFLIPGRYRYLIELL